LSEQSESERRASGSEPTEACRDRAPMPEPFGSTIGALAVPVDLGAGLQCLDELRKHLVNIADDAEVGNTEDGGFLVFVDRDDVL
jgi:hypothetical protein